MKTKIYAIIFALLLGIVAYTLISKNLKEKASKKDKNFKVENFEDVTKITILDRQAEKISLKLKDGKWILNDKFPVNEHLFEEMKEALTKMEAFNPVPIVATENVITEMIEHALKVSIFKGNNKPEKVIYVGGPNLSNSASNMLLEYNGIAEKKIYEVGIPGFRGYLTTRFLVNEDDWRSREIFNYSLDQFKEINIKYFNKFGLEDFTLTKENGDYKLQIKDEIYKNEQLDNSSIVNYLRVLANQNVFSYVFSKPEEVAIKDSLLREKKYAEIRIIDQENHEKFMTIIDMPVNKGSGLQYDSNGDPMAYDIDFKYIQFGKNNDWGVLDNSNFGKLFLKPEIFLKK